MEFFAELVFDVAGFLAELVLELAGELVSEFADGDYPKWVKITAKAIILLFFAAVFFGMSAGGVMCIVNGHYIGGAIVFAIEIVLILLALKKRSRR